jgi:hypothetical protein
MASNLTANFDPLMKKTTWEHGLAVLGGLVASLAIAHVVDQRMDLPDEVYGLGTVVGAQAVVPGKYRRYVQAGGVAHTGMSAGNRVVAQSDSALLMAVFPEVH